MSYSCRQEVIVIEDAKTCDQVFEEYILKPALQFIGLDCEWNTNRPVSLLQVATPTVVMLVRISKLNFAVPRNVRLVLEDPTIYKVGVNIQNDSDKLETDCLCQIKSWVDLRHVAVRSSSWVPCVVAQIDNLEFELQYYNQHDPNSESAKTANGKRLSWSPKMGLESLISECMDMKLPKNSSARWNDDWEIDMLQLNQETYAANDATASLDIFLALVSTSVASTSLPVSELDLELTRTVEEYSTELQSAIKELIDVPFMQTREDTLSLYKQVETQYPTYDLKNYYTKPPISKSKKEKNEKKDFYRKKRKEALKADTPKAAPPLLPTTQTESSPDNSKNSFTFQEITSTLQDTIPDVKTMAENFVNTQVDSDDSQQQEAHLPKHCQFAILFYFRHISDRAAALLPGFSYGRGSVPPAGYRRFRSADSQTQTDFEFDEALFKFDEAQMKNFKSESNEFQRNIYTNTSRCIRFPPTINSSLPTKTRTESPFPNSTTDDDVESVSSYASSNYQSCASIQRRQKGRGRGRKPPVSTVGSFKGTDSDSEVKKGRGRGRGAVSLNLGASSSITESDHEKISFTSQDIRYIDSQDDLRPKELDINNRSRNPTTSSVSSSATPRQQSICEPSSLADLTPTNVCKKSLASPQQCDDFEQEFFQNEPSSSYSTFSIQDLIKDPPAPPTFTSSRSTPSAARDTGSTGSMQSNSRNSNNPRNNNYNNARGKQSNNRDKLSTNRDNQSTSRGHINQNYEYQTPTFRQSGGSSLHTASLGSFTKHTKEEVNIDWAKFREDNGLSNSKSDDESSKVVATVEFSDSDEDFFGGDD